MSKRVRPRCLQCNRVITEWNGRGSRPRFCAKPRWCRLEFMIQHGEGVSICARPGCRKEFTRTYMAQVYCCDQHRIGCKWCGEEVPAMRYGQKYANDYCTVEHRDLAWADEPLPICPVCHEKVDLLKTNPLKDPPKGHARCYTPYSIAQGMRQGKTNKEILAQKEEELYKYLLEPRPNDVRYLRRVDMVRKQIAILQKNA